MLADQQNSSDFVDTGCRLENFPCAMADRDRGWKNQRNLCRRLALMMMMIMNVSDTFNSFNVELYNALFIKEIFTHKLDFKH